MDDTVQMQDGGSFLTWQRRIGCSSIRTSLLERKTNWTPAGRSVGWRVPFWGMAVNAAFRSGMSGRVGSTTNLPQKNVTRHQTKINDRNWRMICVVLNDDNYDGCSSLVGNVIFAFVLQIHWQLHFFWYFYCSKVQTPIST